jgi:hypothetical protein
MISQSWFSERIRPDRLDVIRKAEKIKHLAVREFAQLTGIDELEITKKMEIRRIGETFEWIEFEYEDSVFCYKHK